MARAETIESVEETGGGGGGGGNGPLPRHTCRMELPRPFPTWPGLLTTTTGGAGVPTGGLVHRHHGQLHPLQAVCLSYSLPYARSDGRDDTQSHRRSAATPPALTPPPSPLCDPSEGQSRGRRGEHSDERPEAHSRGPPPDLLPQNEHPSWASPRPRASGEEAALELRRVAGQLRAIGDQFDATVRRRAHGAPHWRDWRDACRGILSFIAQTLSALYRLT